MKKLFIFSIALFTLYSCAPVKPTTSSSSTTNTNVHVSPQAEIVNVYNEHPSASPLLSKEKLSEKKLFKDLNEAFVNPAEVFRVKLEGFDKGFDMLHLTPRIGELYNLQEIEISGAYESLPKEIGKLTQLQFVTIRLYSLKNELPKEISNWKNIQSLTIENSYSSANIQSAPLKWSSVQLLTNLKDLRIEGKEIVYLPENIGDFKNLENLSIYGMDKLTQFPDLANCKSLKNISLDHLDNLLNFSDNIGSYNSLRELSLNSCKKINSYPKEIEKYDSLEIKVSFCPNLNFRPKSFVHFSESKFGFSCMKNLRVFPGEKVYSLKENELEYYKSLGVEKYGVNVNEAMLTKDKSLVKKVSLHFGFFGDSNNLFLHQLDLYPNLESISMSIIPEEILNVTKDITKKIKYLEITTFHDVSKNQNWTSFNALLNRFKNVEKLSIIGNLHYLNETTFLFPNLKSFIIDGIGLEGVLLNNLSKTLLSCKSLEHIKMNVATDCIPNEIFSLVNLKTIDILIWEPKANYTCVIPKEIGNLKKLEKIKIYVNDFFNPLKSSIDPEINTLVNLTEMELIFGFDKKRSQIMNYPNGIENLKKLEKLTLSPIINPPVGLEKLKLKVPFKND